MTSRARLAVQAAVATVCAATALSAVFADERWLGPVVVTVALVALANQLTRRSPVAAALGPVLSAGVVLCYLTAEYAGSTAYAGFVPTAGSLRVLADVARGGFDDIRTLTTPVPTHPGLVLLSAVAMGAVALVVDLFAVTLRRAALAGLPLLAVFAVCTSVSKKGVGWLPFAIGTAGYLWLLLVDSRDRIGRWGRTFSSESASGARITWADVDVAPSPLSALGRRIGASAIAVGVLVPMLVPGLHGGLPKRGSGGDGIGRGSSQVMTINPLVNIRAQLTSRSNAPVLRVRTSDPSPHYLRLTSLDHFNGTTFSPSTLIAPSSARVSHGLTAPDLPGTKAQATISVAKLSVHWLPVPMQVRAPVDVKGDWRYDAATSTIFSARSDTQDLTYSVASVRYEPSALDLDTAPFVPLGELAQYRQLPRDLPQELYALADSITGQAVSAYRKALAIQDYLTGPGFTYDTSVTDGDSTNALAQFLLVTKRGFCQQYAAAMAVLARMVGIPSRVAVGFTRGTRQSDGTWLVTARDAHAWPELYFPGFGWLPFEPTPRGDGQTRALTFARAAAAGEPNDVGPNRSSNKAPTSRPQSAIDKKLDSRETPVAVTKPPAAHRHHAGSSRWWVVLAVLLLLPAPAVAHAVTRRRRWARAQTPTARAHAAWAELRAGVLDAGGSWFPGTTPRATARVVAADAALSPVAVAALRRVVQAEERARYAADAGTDLDGDSLRRDAAAVVHELRAQRSGWERLRALMWPRSTMLAARQVTERVADLLDLVDVAGATVARAWRRGVQPPKPRPS